MYEAPLPFITAPRVPDTVLLVSQYMSVVSKIRRRGPRVFRGAVAEHWHELVDELLQVRRMMAYLTGLSMVAKDEC